MICKHICLAIALASIAGHANADLFHFGSAKDSAQTAEGSRADVIEGVLLRKEEGLYVIRIEGGVVTVPVSSVHKIEKTELSIVDIENREQRTAGHLVTANEIRRERLLTAAAEAAARRNQARVREASLTPPGADPDEKRLTVNVDFQGLLPNYIFKAYDPVLRRANLSGLATVVREYLRSEVKRTAHRKQ